MGSIKSQKQRVLNRGRAIDQIHADLRNPRQLAEYVDSVPEEDRPAMGAHHCIECSRWFEQEHNLREHRRGKNHKRRLRMLKEEPYSQKESDAASGVGTASFYLAKVAREQQQRVDEEQRKMEIEA